MKSIMKKTTAVLTALTMTFTFSACSGSKTSSTAPASSATASAIDYSAYPAEFASWTINDVKTLFKNEGIMVNDAFITMDLTDGDLSAMTATSGFLYVDAEGGTVVDTVIYFDSATDAGKTMIDGVKEHKAIVINGDVENGVPVDALLGDFCISYLVGTDDAHINTMVAVLKDVAAHYNIEGSYVNE